MAWGCLVCLSITSGIKATGSRNAACPLCWLRELRRRSFISRRFLDIQRPICANDDQVNQVIWYTIIATDTEDQVHLYAMFTYVMAKV